MAGKYIYTPIELSDLFADATKILPGDTIIKLDKEINYDCNFAFSGSSLAPVIIKPYVDKGIFKGGFIHINGHDLRFENMEFYYADWVKRYSTDLSGNDTDLDLTKSFEVYGYNVEFYRCIIHDFSDVGSWDNSLNIETKFTECIIYYNGWQSVDRGHGYNMYGQNSHGRKILERCIIFSAYRNNIHFNAATKEQIGFDIIDCINFGTGSVSDPALPHEVNNYILGSEIKLSDINFTRNEIYTNSRMPLNWGIFLGYNTPVDKLDHITMIDNYIDCPRDSLGYNYPVTIGRILPYSTITGNYFYGPDFPGMADSYPLNTYGAARTSGKRTRMIKCDGERGHIVIYNYDEDATIDVDLTGILVTGDNYKLINVQDFTDIMTGVVGAANMITIPMTGRTISNPIMGTNYDNTFPRFGCFIIEKI